MPSSRPTYGCKSSFGALYATAPSLVMDDRVKGGGQFLYTTAHSLVMDDSGKGGQFLYATAPSLVMDDSRKGGGSV